MGYETYFYGDINLGNISEQTLDAIRKRLQKMEEGDELWSVTRSDDGSAHIEIDTSIKNYYEFDGQFPGFTDSNTTNNTLLQMLRRIAMFFPDETKGTIEARGDDFDDFWNLEINATQIKMFEGIRTYKELSTFQVPDDAAIASDVIINKLRGHDDEKI